MSKGFFLTFEGLDGSGKSTQLRMLAAWLEKHPRPSGGHANQKILVTRQPGGTRIGDRIRTLLLDSKTEDLSPLAELGLMFSDRAQAIEETIAPALAAGTLVLCDRFTDSTEAYQGGGRQLGSDIVLRLHAALCGGLQPDLTLLLLPDFDASLARARRRNERMARTGADEGRFERENELFYRRVFEKYQEIAAREAARVVVLSGDEPIPKVHERVVAIVEARLNMSRV